MDTLVGTDTGVVTHLPPPPLQDDGCRHGFVTLVDRGPDLRMRRERPDSCRGDRGDVHRVRCSVRGPVSFHVRGNRVPHGGTVRHEKEGNPRREGLPSRDPWDVEGTQVGRDTPTTSESSTVLSRRPGDHYASVVTTRRGPSGG